MPEPYLKLYVPPLKGVCLEWYFPDGKDSRNFRDWVFEFMPRRTGWFHQGGSHDLDGGWHLFEFWNYDHEKQTVLAMSKLAAEKFGKELIIEL